VSVPDRIRTGLASHPFLAILITGLAAAMLVARPAASDETDPASEPSDPPAASPAEPSPDEPPQGESARQPAPPDRAPEPTADEVLKMLTPKEGTPRPLVRPTLPGRPARTTPAPEALPRNAVVPVERRLLPDGYRLVDRVGRLQREGEYWTLVFESRSTQTVEPPIRLLPNRLLEDMEIASAGGTRPLVFIVSGEVTEYHGVNYLLVQKLLIRPSMGNLR